MEMRISCKITTADGYLELNDGMTYRLAADTTTTRTVQHRRSIAKSPFVHGSYTVATVMENVEEMVGVYVYGKDNADLRDRLEELTNAFTQHRYTLTWDYGDDVYAWLCQVADYQVDTRREFQHATMALATFQVSRYPGIFEA